MQEHRPVVVKQVELPPHPASEVHPVVQFLPVDDVVLGRHEQVYDGGEDNDPLQ